MAAQTRTVSVTTSYVALANLPGRNVSILNRTGADLLVRMASETTAAFEVTIPTGGSVGMSVNNNAKEIEIKAAAGAAGVDYIVEP